ncbi:MULTISPECIES: GNAT family N-acetyltransferase [unclassified Curtobacterium]|uniref:GNAT family N-acetyltransferase n=1 Tax=unclassified Curtobacterium TaxID=257496 RepID=UPI000DA9E195|nr:MULTISPECIES: GNAT family N-acetyltransferase [unclassified Curtobacterium]PZE32231.1 GNAT family N-acetyltransferase [Curtobacterium sp. MCLR17_055]PZF40780.1 GNAT family N-acetyltransferase [Curtobacterium sp. MCLR17_053]PZF52994.1 GNAT family N-acetyltransferase [Curtobacterium sp. MCLR17_051]
MLELVRPQTALYEAWAEAHAEWGPGVHEDGFGITAQDDVGDEDGFRTWVGRLHARPGALWWIVEDGRVLGGIALRAPGDAAGVQRFGHVGYGIRPSARGRGVATWALGQVLAHASRVGIDPVIAVCRDDNDGSIGVLEHYDAVLLSTERRGGVRLRRYAIARSHRRPG